MTMTRFHRRQPTAFLNDRRGSVLVMIVVGVVMLLAMTMISVDIATMQLARAELRAATDAAAKAGAEALLRTQNQSQATSAAVSFAALNNVAGKAFKIKSSDVVIGTSTQQTDGSWAFATGGTKPNAVRVNSSMANGSASGPVQLLFGKVFNSGSFSPSKSSTASATQQEICLVIDRSGSMSFDLTGVDFAYPPDGDYDRPPRPGSRWYSLCSALDLYLAEVALTSVPSRVALVTWASDTSGWDLPKADLKGLPKRKYSPLASIVSRLEAGLSFTFTTLNAKIDQLTEYPLYGMTNMSAGIDMGVQTLTSNTSYPYAQKTIVLMTDGLWNDGRDPKLAAADAANAGVLIHVVTFLSGAASADAKAVADITGGTYIHANTDAELQAAFQKLARTLPVVLTD
jgi:Ca-activated chloride channel homolog